MQKGDRITEVMSTLPSMSQRTALAAEAVRRYKKDVVAFVQDCCKIKQEEKGKPSLWLPFSLWPSQVAAARVIDEAPRSIVLKARQLGMTWLSLAVMLHRVVFQPGAVCLIVSLRETEAIETLAKLRGMYDRLPPWSRPSATVLHPHPCLISPRSSASIGIIPTLPPTHERAIFISGVPKRTPVVLVSKRG